MELYRREAPVTHKGVFRLYLLNQSISEVNQKSLVFKTLISELSFVISDFDIILSIVSFNISKSFLNKGQRRS